MALDKEISVKKPKQNEDHLAYYVIIADEKGTKKVVSEFRSTEEAAISSVAFFAKTNNTCSLFRLVK